MDADIGFLPPALLAVLFIVLLVLFFQPIKKAFKFLLHVVLGFVLLFALKAFGLDLPLNLLNCIIAGFLGIPGVLILTVYYLL